MQQNGIEEDDFVTALVMTLMVNSLHSDFPPYVDPIEQPIGLRHHNIPALLASYFDAQWEHQNVLSLAQYVLGVQFLLSFFWCTFLCA
jgi:hypothetical protein